ncbi:YqaJ viral recombinase family nuclease [Azospirillum sp. sgz302134]
MNVIDHIQGTPQWHAWRAGKVTASEAAVVLGKSPYKTPYRLWAEKVGLIPEEDLSRNPNVRRGKQLEEVIRHRMAESTGMLLVPMCGECSEHPELAASFDALDDDGCPVEIKAPGQSVFGDLEALGEDSEAYRLYWHQVQHQLLVAGAKRATLIFACETQTDGKLDVIEFTIERDDAFLADYIPTALEFARKVRENVEPDKDPARDVWAPTSEEERAAWDTFVTEYRSVTAALAAAKAEMDKAKKAVEAVEQKLVAKMDAFSIAEAGGLRINRFLVRGTVDYKALLADHCPDLPESEINRYRKSGSISTKFTLQKEKATAANAA